MTNGEWTESNVTDNNKTQSNNGWGRKKMNGNTMGRGAAGAGLRLAPRQDLLLFGGTASASNHHKESSK